MLGDGAVVGAQVLSSNNTSGGAAMSLGFRIGGREHEYARVEVIGADGDGWLPSRIEVRAGGFQGTFPCDLDRGAFARFAREVRDMHRTLKGTAAFTTYEGQL